MKKLLEQKIKVLVNENSSSRHFENRRTSCLVLGEEAQVMMMMMMIMMMMRGLVKQKK